jgi:radical SAM protein with 4Fe4S-binding SPASM domain
VIDISRLYCGASSSSPLRYGRRDAGRPRRPVVVWNCTRRCNLRCAHCYSASTDAPAPDEMTTAQAEAMLDDLAAFGVPVVLFSGGEPLMRPDVMGLLRRAAALGLRTVLSTNGTTITEAVAEDLAAAGVDYVGVSLDGARRTHDGFRGRPGAFDAALAGLRRCRHAGIKVGLRFTVTRRNVTDVPEVFALLGGEDIPRACFYHLVYTGRGSQLAAEDLDHDQTRRVVDEIIDRTAALHDAGARREVLTVDNHADGPYVYLRLLRAGRRAQAAEALALLRRTGGNASGVGIGCVSWDGAVHPDPFWRHLSLGRVTRRPFSAIWTDATHPVLSALRDRRRRLGGRCAACRFLDVCGGNLRVRAEAAAGDLWAADPACYLTDEEVAELRNRNGSQE